MLGLSLLPKLGQLTGLFVSPQLSGITTSATLFLSVNLSKMSCPP